MKQLLAATAALTLAAPATAQDEPAPSPNEIVAQAEASDWKAIDAEDLLVMTLAPDAQGNARQVVIQLMPPPFSQGWVENIRTLARAGWYDGVSINRVQDNYVVQWGDPNVDNPEAEGETKPLPEGLNEVPESDYTADRSEGLSRLLAETISRLAGTSLAGAREDPASAPPDFMRRFQSEVLHADPYAIANIQVDGWPTAFSFQEETKSAWPIHCYGMVGVGRSFSPDTGSGAELYTVIGHAPRHLDRNIALVGRVIEGIEHLSSLPRGKGALGFYEDASKRVPIESIRLASDLALGKQPSFEYLSTDSKTFALYGDARANRRDPFFIEPAGGADICNIPVPIRRVSE